MLGVLGENLLTLLAFDEVRGPIIRNTVELNLFGGQHKVIAAAVYDYIDKYKKPPQAHLPDILDDKLNSDNKREAQLYHDLITSMHEAKDGINAEYVMTELETFVRRQSYRSIAVDLVKALQRDTEESLADAEQLIRKAQHSSLSLFDPGTRLSDNLRALEFLDRERITFPTGIPEFDKRGFGPTRKEQWLFIAPTGKGKTWGLIHLAKMAIMQRLRVVHITLEVSEEIAAQRYFQALFAMAKRDEILKVTKFKKDELGRIVDYDRINVTPSLSLDDPHIKDKLIKKIDQWKDRILKNVIIKEFPTGTLTVPRLNAYLDNLEQQERFVPDLLITDYPDLMKISPDNQRLELGRTYIDLRGVAVARNLASAVVTQGNRASADAKVVKSSHVAEDWSKIAGADVVITYSQTEAEKMLGLARLYVAKGRNDSDGITVVISQQYGIGAFVADSTLMKGNYFEMLPTAENADDD